MDVATAERSLSPSYWRDLVPGLTVEGAVPLVRRPVSAEAREEARQVMLSEGYFEVHDMLDPAALVPLVGAIDRLLRAGWFPVFGLVYDEFWDLGRQLGDVLGHLLGPQYRQAPVLWISHITVDGKQGGRKAARDNPAAVGPDGSPLALTVFIPLTEVGPLNGCPYLVPADRDSGYAEGIVGEIDIQNVRALPAQPGTVLGWNHRVYHWGARSSLRAAPRHISVTFDFQRGDVAPFQEPLLDPQQLPDFRTRLSLIGGQVLRYRVPPAMRSLCEMYQRSEP